MVQSEKKKHTPTKPNQIHNPIGIQSHRNPEGVTGPQKHTENTEPQFRYSPFQVNHSFNFRGFGDLKTFKVPPTQPLPFRRVSRTAGSPPAVDSVFGWGKGMQGSWLMTSCCWFRNPIPNQLGCSRNLVNYGIFTISTGELNPDV